jgi:hypothetical protein
MCRRIKTFVTYLRDQAITRPMIYPFPVGDNYVTSCVKNDLILNYLIKYYKNL